ncbi:MAG: hypothetical protein VYC07_06175 [Pseudomonadota bacterium]|nr:hypothetical protein [Gammaproteobacteria bacterium]MEC8834264.1 hypothetical protein [Pseudomonadota bacterium]HBP14873.1 hypothetical protein [Gammaproteobacteria bacterium]HCP49090.1 hypothetical protein [Gammaproteobacteria bacterium]
MMRWVVLIVVYVTIFFWYTNFESPLTRAEADSYLTLIRERGVDQERLAALTRFLYDDDGDDFVMVNLIDMRQEDPTKGGETPSQLLDRYMEYMWPSLILRACHPVVFSQGNFEALDIWGIDGAQKWSRFALMRYRSRRDMLEISTDPRFEGSHNFKIAAMHKTVAFPVAGGFGYSDPRWILAAVFLVLGLLRRRRD